MTEEERRRYFGILLESLYDNLQVLAESTLLNKREIAAELIHEFYKDYKEDYKIKDIKEITQGLDRVNQNMKEAGRKTDIKSIYDQEEPGER